MAGNCRRLRLHSLASSLLMMSLWLSADASPRAFDTRHIPDLSTSLKNRVDSHLRTVQVMMDSMAPTEVGVSFHAQQPMFISMSTDASC